jgi:hypothetical protein
MNIRGFAAVIAVLSGMRASWAQCQVQKVVASDAENGAHVGRTISASGDWLIVAAHEDDDLGVAAGAAYIYQRQGSDWIETQKLHASDGASGEEFSYAVGISGDIAVASAFFDSPGGVYTAGSAYVFERSGTSWLETAKLVASDGSSDDHFGHSAAISGNRIVIGVCDDDPAGDGSGSVYVFEKTGNAWLQTAKLTPSDQALGDCFGYSVAIEGDRIVISSLGDEGPQGMTNTGSAYVFDHTQTGWVQTQKLVPNDPTAGQRFGAAVSISGSTLLVGAGSDSTAGTLSGSVYAYELQGSSWTFVQEFAAIDSNPQNQFGYFLTHVGDTAIVGALSDTDSGFASGSAYVFQRSGSLWTQRGKMLAVDGGWGDLLGSAVALVGTTAFATAPYADDACPTDPNCDSGTVYVFELAPTAVQYGSCRTLAPCSNWDDHGGCRNSAGQGAVVAACGSGSVSTDDLRLEATRCPPNKLTLLFMGPAQGSVLYGDGVRVVSPQNPMGIYRYGGAQADAQGRVLRGPGLVAQSQTFPTLGRIQSGQTWNFTFWYRDLQGPCHGLTNFTNGVQVAFGP